MEIAIIFERAFHAETQGAVWIVESPENRRWFTRQTDLDASSAIFTLEGDEISKTAILRSIWNVQEHYPNWSKINVRGASLTPDLSRELQEEGILAEMSGGFSLSRP